MSLFRPSTGNLLLLTGAGILAFSSGFGVCLFNLDTVGACEQLANGWTNSFTDMGNHIVMWGITMFHGIMKQ